MEHAILAVFIEESHFEAAIDREPQPVFDRFENTADGVKAFARWLVEVLPGTTEAIDACVAVSESAPKETYETPVFEFVYDNSRNTFIWSPEQIAGLPAPGGGNAAASMLPTCVNQHAPR